MRRSLCYFALPALVAFAGCGEDDGPSAPAPPAGHSTAAEVVDAFAAAMTERNLAAYVALLEPTPGTRGEAGFRWYPQDLDIEDFPWLSGLDCWDLATEIDIITNMFDPTFVSTTTGQSIQSISVALDLETITELPENEAVVKTHADVRVFWAEEDGVRSDVRLEFLLVRGEDGFLKVRTIHEKSLLGREFAVPSFSFSSVKDAYRSAAP